jgi:hypothetical protein
VEKEGDGMNEMVHRAECYVEPGSDLCSWRTVGSRSWFALE